jgi:hypothetical protein
MVGLNITIIHVGQDVRGHFRLELTGPDFYDHYLIWKNGGDEGYKKWLRDRSYELGFQVDYDSIKVVSGDEKSETMIVEFDVLNLVEKGGDTYSIDVYKLVGGKRPDFEQIQNISFDGNTFRFEWWYDGSYPHQIGWITIRLPSNAINQRYVDGILSYQAPEVPGFTFPAILLGIGISLLILISIRSRASIPLKNHD